MPVLSPGVIYLLLVLLCTNGVTGIMWYVTKKGAAEYQQQVKLERAETEKAHLKQLADAAAVNDRLTASLLNKENELAQLSKEKSDEIAHLTTGRRCLDGRAVRVLNRPKPASKPQIPETSAGPVPEDGAFATDTDVGQWIVTAQEQYERCRTRIDAIATFYEENP